MMCAYPMWEIICQRWFPTMDDVGNIAVKNKKRGPTTYVKNVSSPRALQHAPHLFMANNHHQFNFLCEGEWLLGKYSSHP
ncbi:hypothetical protein TNCV_4773631 [Trichonephila clavipes]|nr:hypothetical protein TNCV_4773631 [Trichonephila clavipes]